MTVRVVVIEDHVMLRDLLVLEINHVVGLECVGDFGSYDLALKKLPALAPDVVLLDLSLPGTPGVDATREIKRQWPLMKILIFSGSEDEKTVLSLFAAGCNGYALKSESAPRLCEKICQVNNGDFACSQPVVNILAKAKRTNLLPAKVFEALSPMENRILDEFACGSDYKRVCELFEIANDTLKTHVKRICKKLLADSTAQAVFHRQQAAL